MEIRPLSINDHTAWAHLLAMCFDRTDAQMELLLQWYDSIGMIAYGAWEGLRLVGQYAVLKRYLQIPSQAHPQLVGLSLNMAIHPDFRGRGLVKQMSVPTYSQLATEGGIAGVGFSNAEGVQVDRKSKGYGYKVVGQMCSWIVLPLRTTTHKINTTHGINQTSLSHLVSFAWDTRTLTHRYHAHPFRTYQTVAGSDSVLMFRELGKFGVSLLGAYGNHLSDVLDRWWRELGQQGKVYIHFLSTPNSRLLKAMRQIALVLPLPITRNPQYLTVKPLNEALNLLDFEQWDCTGGDIL